MEGPVVTTQELFMFERQGILAEGRIAGRFRPTGVRPHFSDRIAASGIRLAADLFTPVNGGLR
jgi:pilus assembly protein CpaF